jgi:hypothetical protein
MPDDLVPPPYPDAKVRYRRGEFSERTGRYAGEMVEWAIPAGHDIYEPGQGAGMVTVPNDGGFVWITYEGGQSIVPAEFVRPARKEGY